jgi:hypothetical protein
MQDGPRHRIFVKKKFFSEPYSRAIQESGSDSKAVIWTKMAAYYQLMVALALVLFLSTSGSFAKSFPAAEEEMTVECDLVSVARNYQDHAALDLVCVQPTVWF